MAYTISTHNGSRVARQHNLRNIKVVSKEEHIDMERPHETWLDIRPQDAYRQLFDDARRQYNDEQISKGHPERTIEDYYIKIREDKKKHPVYEMIIQIGSYDNHPDIITARQILKEFCETWNQRNPNMVMIGAYYHDDEGTPHVHIDYIPVAYNMERGMECQTALVKALNQMGYATKGIHDTAQIQWERAQNYELERICREHGLTIEHPEIEYKQHMDISRYRTLKQIEELKDQKGQLEDIVNDLIKQNNDLIDKIERLELGVSEVAHEIVNNETMQARYDIDRTR